MKRFINTVTQPSFPGGNLKTTLHLFDTETNIYIRIEISWATTTEQQTTFSCQGELIGEITDSWMWHDLNTVEMRNRFEKKVKQFSIDENYFDGEGNG